MSGEGEEVELEFLVSGEPIDLEAATSPVIQETQENTPKSGMGSFLSDTRFKWLLSTEEEEEEEDRPLLEELDIDLKDILYKIRCVLFPIKINREVLLASPDFWGPMFVILLYGFLLVFRAMSWVFTVWLVGSFIIFIITRALGGEVSFSQTIGVIGYSLLPELLVVIVLFFVYGPSWLVWTIKITGTLWSCFSAGSLLASAEIQHKRILVMYPVLLLYIYFASLQSGF